MDCDSSSDVDVVLAYYLIYTKNVSENTILKSSNARFLRPSPRSHTFDRGLPPSTAVRYLRRRKSRRGTARRFISIENLMGRHVALIRVHAKFYPQSVQRWGVGPKLKILPKYRHINAPQGVSIGRFLTNFHHL